MVRLDPGNNTFSCSFSKTYTLFGRGTASPGLYQMCLEKLFNEKNLKISMSFFEVYLEKVNDLMDETKKDLRLKQNEENGVYVNSLTKVEVEHLDDVREYVRHGLR